MLVCNYLVEYGRRRFIFATLEEANGFCNEVMRKTGYVLAVTNTDRSVTHTWNR